MIEIFQNTYIFLFILIISIAIDLIFGELPLEVHPVAIIGKIIGLISETFLKMKNKWSGLLLTLVGSVIALFFAEAIFIICNTNIYFLILIISLGFSSTFSIKFLLSSAKGIKTDLKKRIQKARRAMGHLVSRDTKNLSERLIISATIESLSENITDSVIAPIFYYIFSIIIIIISIAISHNNYYIINQIYILTLPVLIAILYRVINTLDAMVGYKNEKFSAIGYFPAKLDDILNYIPSRFGGFMVVISAFLLKMDWKNSYYILKRDARACPSPNSGFTMAATAGALDVQLEKEDVYHIGDNNKELEKDDICEAIKLSKVAIALSILVLILVYLVITFLVSFL